MTSERLSELPPLPAFMHIQKAAGHSVRALLHANCGDGEYIDVIVRKSRSDDGGMRTPASGDLEIATLVAELRARQDRLGFVATNLAFGLQHYMDRELFQFTFMREPVDRCLSYWYFCYNNRDEHPGWSNLARYDFNLERLFRDGHLPQFQNAQTRMIVGTSELEMTTDHLELAKARISDDFAFVGAFDRLQECVAELARMLGWQQVEAEHRNASPRTAEASLPDDARDRFGAENEIDTALYTWLLDDYLPPRLEASRELVSSS